MRSKNAQASIARWLEHPPRRKKGRRNASAPAGVALGDLLSQLDPEVGPQRPAAGPLTQTEWESLVGPRIADRSAPERIDADGTLVVRVPTSVWAQELSMLSTTILQRVSSFGLRVVKLRLVVGEAPQQMRPTSQRFVRRKVAAQVPLPSSIRVTIDEIQDEALREVITRAAAASLSEAAADERRAKAEARRKGKTTPGSKR